MTTRRKRSCARIGIRRDCGGDVPIHAPQVSGGKGGFRFPTPEKEQRPQPEVQSKIPQKTEDCKEPAAKENPESKKVSPLSFQRRAKI